MKNNAFKYIVYSLALSFGAYCNAMESGSLQNQKEAMLEKINQASSSLLSHNSMLKNIIAYKGQSNKYNLETSDGYHVYIPHTIVKKSKLFQKMFNYKKKNVFESGKLACDAQSLI